jgi:hypothetical protein
MASATFNWTVASRLQSSVAAALHSSLHPQEGGKGKAGAAATATFSAANVSAGMPWRVTGQLLDQHL